MTPEPRETPADDRADEVLRDYMLRVDRGEVLDREEFLCQHPDVADEATGRALNRAQACSEEPSASLTHSVSEVPAETATSPSLPASVGPAVPRPVAAPVPLDQVVRFLTDCGILSRKGVKDAIDQLSLEGQSVGGSQLAEELYREGTLTRFQRDAIRAGKAEELLLGNYVLLDRLGRGGMGQVYRAWHRKMDRVVALKTLRRETMKLEEPIRRFRREVKAAAKLVHPNIVTAYDADEARGTHFLVMEYVEGGNLADWVRAHGPAPLNEAVNWLLQAAQALEYAHHRGVVHRDVKPGNLLLSEEGAVKVLDMGLARIGDCLAGTEAEDRLTRTGDVLGTIDYMAPEQALDTRHADHRADIYSLGCTLHYLLLARPPYGGQTFSEKLLGHRKHAIPSLRAGRADVPQWLDTLFQRMLAKQAGDRPESMVQVIAELERHREPTVSSPEGIRALCDGAASAAAKLAGKNAAGREASQPSQPAEAAGRASTLTGRRRRWKAAAAVALGTIIVALVLAGVYSLRTPAGTLTVEVNEPGAKVEVLDAEGTVTVTGVSGADSLVFSVAPGKHLLKVQKDGFEFFSQEFLMEVRGKQTVRAAIERSKSEEVGRAASDQPGKLSRELDEASKTVSEKLAKGKWTPVTPSSIAEWSLQERKTYTRVPEKPALTDGRILLSGMMLGSPFQLRDGAVRAKVRLTKGSKLVFYLRMQNQRGLAAVYTDGLGSLGRQTFGTAPAWVSLDTRRHDRKYEGEHEITFATVRELVVFYLDGQPMLSGHDPTPMPGGFLFGTDNGSVAELRDISVLVLDEPRDESMRAAIARSKSEQGGRAASDEAKKPFPELDEASRTVNEKLAKGKWTPATPSSIAEWSLMNGKTGAIAQEKPALTDGRIRLCDVKLVSPFVLRDGAVRAKVRLIEGGKFYLGLRYREPCAHALVYSYDRWVLGRNQPAWVTLDSQRQDGTYYGEHEITIAAVGGLVVFYLDGQPMLGGHDTTPMPGWLTLAAVENSVAEFRDISFLVLDDPPHESVRAAASSTVNEKLLKGKWTPVTPSSLAEWSLYDRKSNSALAEKPVWKDGKILLSGMALTSLLQSRDGAVRAKVRLIEGNELIFVVRRHDRYGLSTVYRDGLWDLGRNNFGGGPAWVSLDARIVNRKYEGEHEITFAAVGELVVFYLDGQPMLHSRDATPMPGRLSLETQSGSVAEFHDISVLVLDDPVDAAKRPVIDPGGKPDLPLGTTPPTSPSLDKK